MNNQELYDKVILAYKAGDENMFNAAARNYAAKADDAPFDDPEARELFFSAKRNYHIWQNKAISGRVSKLRMIEDIRKLAEKDLPNPYLEQRKVIKKSEQVKKAEPVHVLGVVPEEPEQKEEKRLFPRRRKKQKD